MAGVVRGMEGAMKAMDLEKVISLPPLLTPVSTLSVPLITLTDDE